MDNLHAYSASYMKGNIWYSAIERNGLYKYDLQKKRNEFVCFFDEEKILKKENYKFDRIYSSTNYSDILNKEILDAVLIATSWNNHIDIAVESLNKNIAVGLEVGGSYSEEDCWQLVRTVEKTGTPFMFLENCCFDKAELLATSMTRAGLFGKIVSCSGSYSHDLRDEIITGKEKLLNHN